MRAVRDERVRVHCRLRPPKDAEEAPPHDLFGLEEDGSVNFARSPGEQKNFAFDSFFGQATSQERVYEEVAKGIVDRVLNGYNGTIFAYGQTGTGKSHTMMGPSVEGASRGIVPRALEQVFDTAARDGAHDYTVSVSYVQLYCELLQDLLEPELNRSLSIREDTEKGVYVEGASTFPVTSKEDCLHYLRVGEESRVTACTNMNAASSRSHAAFMVNVEKRARVTDVKIQDEASLADSPKVYYGKLFIVGACVCDGEGGGGGGGGGAESCGPPHTWTHADTRGHTRTHADTRGHTRGCTHPHARARRTLRSCCRTFVATQSAHDLELKSSIE
jgi:kinesin family protein 5